MALDARVLLGPHGSEKHGGVNDYVDVAFHLPRWARVSIPGPPDHPVYALRYERCLAKPLAETHELEVREGILRLTQLIGRGSFCIHPCDLKDTPCFLFRGLF